MPNNEGVEEIDVERREEAPADFELSAGDRARIYESHERIEEGVFISIMDDDTVSQTEAAILFGRFSAQCQEEARIEADTMVAAGQIPEGVDAQSVTPRANVSGQMKFASILARTIQCKELAWDEYDAALLEASQRDGMADLVKEIQAAKDLMVAEFEATQRQAEVDENQN